MTFQLDTSGGVPMPSDAFVGYTLTRWSDLSPFCQGYIEAMLREHCKLYPHTGFSDLAPATLARIIADCAGLQKLTPPNWGESFAAGELAWKCRAGGWVGFRDDFPPLLVTLGDDGLIYLGAGQ